MPTNNEMYRWLNVAHLLNQNNHYYFFLSLLSNSYDY